MARTQTIDVRPILTRLLPNERLDELATAAAVVQRHRKLDVRAFFWTLVLGFGTGQQRTLAQLRRA